MNLEICDYHEIMNDHQKIEPVHPGEIIRQDVLIPLSLSPDKLADLLGVNSAELMAVLNGEKDLTAELALRLSACLGSSPDFWLGLQNEYSLQTARDLFSAQIEAEVTRLVPPRAA